MIITITITSIIALIIGYISASTVLRKSIERKSENILKDAEKASEQLKKDKILQAFPDLEDFSATSIAKKVFKNSESQAKINNIIHPMIGDLILERINEKKALHNIFVVDAALIIESGIFEQHQKSGAKLILVIADEKIRLKRAIDRDNLEEETIKDRIRLQMKDDEKSEYSDYVIENNGSEFELFSKIDQIIEEII